MELIVKWSTLNGTFQQKLRLKTVLWLLTSIKLARILDMRNVTNDRQISDKEEFAAVLTARGQEVNQANRQKLSDELKIARKMMEFFGKDLGLLCFTDFEKAPKTRFRWTSHDIMKRFQSSIDREI